MAFKPSQRRRREEEVVDINLLPMMNIVCSLIVLLLGVANLASIAMLEYLPPAADVESTDDSAAPVEASKWNNDATINLLVNIAETGFQVSLFGHTDPGPYYFEILRLPDGHYDFETLTKRLGEIETNEIGGALGMDSTLNDATGKMIVYSVYRYRDGNEVSITALGATQFQTVVSAMDACRHKKNSDGTSEELFPVAMLKQFQ